MLTKILYGLYFLIWTVFILFAYTALTNEYYAIGTIFGRLVGLIALTLTFVTLLTLLIIFTRNPYERAKTKKAMLICTTPLILLIPFTIAYLLPNNLDKQKHTIQISYVAWGCDCANWNVDLDNGQQIRRDKSQTESIFIEAASKDIALPDSIGYTGDIIKLTGQFYSRKGFPKDYDSQEWPDKARIFRYTDYKIISSNYSSLSTNIKQ